MKSELLAAAALVSASVFAGKIPLPEHPRPDWERAEWMNLNGEWDFGFVKERYNHKITVPFGWGSPLSGVKDDGDTGFYRRRVTVPAAWKGKRVFVVVGASDHDTTCTFDGEELGTHKGGYAGFSFDITPYLNPKGHQKLVVRVWDPTDKGYQPIGKQTLTPNSIWYTAVTGIWQTVWMEPVDANYITNVKSAADIQNGTLELTLRSALDNPNDLVEAVLMDGAKEVSRAKGIANGTLRMAVPDAKLWSPEHPFLYTLKLTLWRDGRKLDEARSYAAMRTIAAVRDWDNGIYRMQLNGENYFQYGPLDQGWFPDGLYTAPTDEALLFDIRKTKELGFNMIRKHVKVEPDRWYYYCDREGILVWQDMPSGDMGNGWEPYKYNGGTDQNRTSQSAQNYYDEWTAIMDQRGQHPCAVVWVPFNEAWGQFETQKVVDYIKSMDPTRLVNPASGGNHRDCGDIFDFHHYPNPAMFLSDPGRVNVLGEYGGIGLPLEGHLWFADKNWGYVKFQSKEEVTKQYLEYAEMLKTLIPRGYSAAVYTQTTDVEGEVNGLMTYDRKEMKMDVEQVRKVNQEVIHTLK